MDDLQPVTDSKQLRAAFGSFPSGVTALCALIEGVPVGMAASSFTSVSIDPPLVSVAMQKTSTTWPVLRKAERLGLSVLADDHDIACMTLSKKEGDRFADVDWDARPTNSVFIENASAHFEVSIFNVLDAGDHEIVLLEVHELNTAPHREPLVFHGSKFRKLHPH